MKVLFLANNDCDYLSNMLLHGLRSLLGSDVVDFPRLDSAYKDGNRPPYGNGFTAYNLLVDNNIDRDDIHTKISNRFFDLVIYAGSQVYSDSSPENFPYWEAFSVNPPRYWAVVDGADELSDSVVRRSNFPSDLLFFCRENRGVGFPISFSIPSEKLQVGISKSTLWASYEPTMRYQFSAEQAYYKNYQEAHLALTRRRGGWDCLRHYEIMACGCVPFFLGIQQCPRSTCTSLPKQVLEQVQQDYFYVFQQTRSGFIPPPPYDEYEKWYPESPRLEPRPEDLQQLLDLGVFFRNHCETHCTTQAEATKFLDHVRRSAC